MKINDNGNGTVTMPKELLKQLYEQYTTVKSDVELSVDTIAKVLIILGIISKEGNIESEFRFRHLLQNMIRMTLDPKGLEKKFSFITDPRCLKVIEKYSYLYKAQPIKAEKSITDLEFEEILK